ncbi:MAG TPA: DUF58 domain-containing protein [Verrucomicrobiae bacterium]|jgi:uncharacterized protein (DUF58 family)|nr:DUF58 domain-containing protein [Verrucomicrobiae bacterium]
MLPEPFTPKFLTQLEILRLRTRKEFLGGHPGSYSSPRRGTSLEFADYRRYAPGDDLRYLDWGIYARTDRLYVKVFREEVDLFAYVFIDASASMAFPSPAEKFLPASHIALALSYVILANHDHVKLHLLQDGAGGRASPFFRGRRRMADCVDFALAARPAGSLALAPAVGEHLRRLRRPGKAILLSDFLMPAPEYQQALNLLRAFNLDIAAIQVLSRQEVDPVFPNGGLALVDSETRAEIRYQWNPQAHRDYQHRLALHNLELRSFCHQSAISYSLYVTDRDLSDFVFKTLPAIGLFK